jgi:hypothetical protein
MGSSQNKEKWRNEKEKEKKKRRDEGVIKQKRQKKPLGEACFSEEGTDTLLACEGLGGGQAEKGCQAVWNPEQGERDPLCCIRSSIASEPLIP